jgi:hypothetical protein
MPVLPSGSDRAQQTQPVPIAAGRSHQPKIDNRTCVVWIKKNLARSPRKEIPTNTDVPQNKESKLTEIPSVF